MRNFAPKATVLVLAGLLLCPLLVSGQGNVVEQILKGMQDAAKQAEAAKRSQQRRGTTQPAPTTATPPPGVEVAGINMKDGTTVAIVTREAIDFGELHEGDVISSFLPNGRIPNGPVAEALVRVTKLAGPVEDGFADVTLALESLDNNGIPFAVSGTTLRLLTSRGDFELARRKGKGGGGGGRKGGSGTTPEVEDILGVQKQPVRLPPGFSLYFKLGTAEAFAAPSSTTPATPPPTVPKEIQQLQDEYRNRKR